MLCYLIVIPEKEITANDLSSSSPTAKFTDGVLYMSPIFIATVPQRLKFIRNRQLCLDSMEYSLHPVFRIMKCIGE